MSIQLPLAKISPISVSPKTLVMYSKPKVGKTLAVSMLENALIIDLENGSDFIEAMKIKASTIDDIKEIVKAIHKAGKPYKYIVVDTLSRLEDMVLPYAKEMYKKTIQGKSFDPTNDKNVSILDIPNGLGYHKVREHFFEVLSWLETCADRVILLGHLKPKDVNNSDTEVDAKKIDLYGKSGRILAANVDSIALMYREEDKCILTFKTADDVICGSRSTHLRNQDIVLTEMIDGQIIAHWDKIYID